MRRNKDGALLVVVRTKTHDYLSSLIVNGSYCIHLLDLLDVVSLVNAQGVRLKEKSIPGYLLDAAAL